MILRNYLKFCFSFLWCFISILFYQSCSVNPTPVNEHLIIRRLYNNNGSTIFNDTLSTANYSFGNSFIGTDYCSYRVSHIGDDCFDIVTKNPISPSSYSYAINYDSYDTISNNNQYSMRVWVLNPYTDDAIAISGNLIITDVRNSNDLLLGDYLGVSGTWNGRIRLRTSNGGTQIVNGEVKLIDFPLN